MLAGWCRKFFGLFFLGTFTSTTLPNNKVEVVPEKHNPLEEVMLDSYAIS
jgi:hypothetical protein